MLSALIPGLGQAYNHSRRLALALFIPFAIVVALAGLVIWAFPGPQLIATAVVPGNLDKLLMLNLVLLGWRLVALGRPSSTRASSSGRVASAWPGWRSSSW